MIMGTKTTLKRKAHREQTLLIYTFSILACPLSLACQTCLNHPFVGSYFGRPFSIPPAQFDSTLSITRRTPIKRETTPASMGPIPSMLTDTLDDKLEKELQQVLFSDVLAVSSAAILIEATPLQETVLAQAILSVVIIYHLCVVDESCEVLLGFSSSGDVFLKSSKSDGEGTEDDVSQNKKKRTLEEVLGLDKDELDSKPRQNNSPEKPVSSAMIATIGVYKNFISPLLPPACRFVPTCSQYGVQAIEEFGSIRGVMLIAWRLLRCSPIGGKGYDPPRWPPVSFTYSSY